MRKAAPTENAPVGDNPLQAVTNCFPQVGENRTTEAPEAFSTSLKGTRVWKPLFPMIAEKPPLVHQ